MVDHLLQVAPWLGLALAVAGLAGIVWALVPGHRSSRRRCPKCWYDMSGALASLRCPECGRTAKSERCLQRRRRRWRIAFLGVFVMVLGGAAAATPDVVRGTWHYLAPTSVLYAMDDSGHGDLCQITFRRLQPKWYGKPPGGGEFWCGWPKSLESGILRKQARARLQHGAVDAQGYLALCCLISIEASPNDLPLLRRALTSSHDYNRYLAGYAMQSLGARAAPAVSDLIRALESRDDWQTRIGAVLALKSIGPDAAAAVNELSKLLHTPRGYPQYPGIPMRYHSYAQIGVLDALGAIGPAAATAIPDILAAEESDPCLKTPAACALVRISSTLPETFARTLAILVDSDVGFRNELIGVLSEKGNDSLRSSLVATLIDRSRSSDVHDRVSAVRALAALDAIPEDSVDDILRDPNVSVRLIGAEWLLGPESSPRMKRRAREIALMDEDPVVSRLAKRGTK